MLSAAGGVLGLGVAFLLTRTLLSFLPQQEQPILITALPDPRILSFALLVTLATTMVFGLLPALRASRPDPWTTLKDTVGSIAGAGGSLFLRKGLVTIQVALSFLLLFGAGLFVRSLQNLKGTDPGVALDNLVTFQLAPALSGYDDQRATMLYRNLLERLKASPGVQSVGLATVPILSGDEWDSSMAVEGHQAKDGEDMQAFMNAVSPDYFTTMKIPLIEGRDFRENEARAIGDDKPGVAIVNRRFAEHFFPGHSAVGKRHRLGRAGRSRKLNDRDHRRRRRFALRGPPRRRSPAGLRPELGPGLRRVLRADAACVGRGVHHDPRRPSGSWIPRCPCIP